MKKLNSSLETLPKYCLGTMSRGNRKIAQVRTKPSASEVIDALNEGVELNTEWHYSSLMTQKQAQRYMLELKNNPFTISEMTYNVVTHPLNVD